MTAPVIDDETKRKLLFVPCKSKEVLHAWIKEFLHLDMPDTIVDPESNSTPMDAIWEVYEAALKNDRPDYSQVLAYASRDSFKCVEKGTLLLSRDGLKPIERVVVGEEIWSGWAWRPVTDWIHDGVKSGKRLVLKNGLTLTTSPVHRVWAWEPGGVPGWKRVADLTSKDLVAADTTSGFATEGDLDQDEYDKGYLCGLLQGDGCTALMDRYGQVTLSSVDEHILSFWRAYVLKVAGREPQQSKSRPCDWTVWSRKLVAHLEDDLGIKPSYAYEKSVPTFCWSSRSAMAGFLSGLLDTDGTINSKKAVELAITAETLCREVQVMLHALGVNASYRVNKLYSQHGQKHPVHRVWVNQNDLPSLWSAGVRFSAKKAGTALLTAPGVVNTHDSIPRHHLAALEAATPIRRTRTGGTRKPVLGRYASVSRSKAQALLAYCEEHRLLSDEEVSIWRDTLSRKWVSVESVEDCEADFYDLTVDVDHSYWSNGIISHNTLGAAVLEVLMVVHLKRDVAHMAAIEAQAKKSQTYVRDFFAKPFLRDYVILQNEKRREIQRFYNPVTGENLTAQQFRELPEDEKLQYEEIRNYITIVICTMAGANCVDPWSSISMADGSSKPALMVSEGDEIVSFHTKDRRWTKTRVKRVSYSEKPSMRVTLKSGASAVLSEDHPVMTSSGWRRTRSLRIGTKVLPYGLPKGDESQVFVPDLVCENPMSALLGTLMGDSSLTWPKNNKKERYGRGPRFQVSHAKKYRPYLERKLEVLRRMGIDGTIIDGAVTDKLSSQTSADFVEVYDLLYPDGKKRVTQALLDRLDLESLAFWIMDDGRGNAERVGSAKDHAISLATCCFTIEENELICRWLRERWGLNATVGSVGNSSGKRYPQVELDLESSRRLSVLLDRYISPVMKYKMPTPESMLDGRCIECGCKVEKFCGNAFTRCEEHAKDGNRTRAAREALKNFKEMFSDEVVHLEYVGQRNMLDIEVEAENDYTRNFVVNGCFTVHNSEHVSFFCVDGDTKILVRSPNSGRARVARTARGLFNRLAGRTAAGRPVESEEPEHIMEPAEDIEVLSFDFNTQSLEFARVEHAHKRAADTVSVVMEDGSEVICTHDHPLYVWGRGFVQAGEIAIGDEVLAIDRAKSGKTPKFAEPTERPSGKPYVADGDEWDQVVLGSLLGDCGIYKKPQNNPYLQEQHCLEQREYLDWKREIVGRRLRTVDLTGAKSGYTGADQVGYRSGCSPLLLPYVDFRKTLAGVERLSALGLAVWYMDDGCVANGLRISSESFTREQNEKLVEVLRENFDIHARVAEAEGRYYISGDVAAKRRLAEVCAPYIHPTMAYKFDLERNQGTCESCGEKFWFYEVSLNTKTCGRAMCRLVKAGTLKRRKVTKIEDAGRRVVYDFTVAGNHNFFTNGLLSKNCVDEVDVVSNPKAYEEAKMIPAPRGKQLPITLYTSTRKFSFGLVQKEIDNAAKTGLEIRHWNIIDVTERCPKERHQPELPMVDVFYSRDDLRTVLPDEYETFPQDKKDKYHPDKAFAGCVKNCKLFAMCRGRLATKQKEADPNAKVPSLLKPIAHTQNQFGKVSVETAKAQLLCWKPSTEGLIYPNFDRDVHMLTPAEMAEKITGDEYPADMTKQELVALLKGREVRFGAGMDFGYTHNFAVVHGAVDGARAFVLDVISVPELEVEQQVQMCDGVIKHYEPKIHADPENPQAIKTFKKRGYRISKVEKGKGSVVGGIELVRQMLRPATGEPLLYFLKGDDGCELLAKRISGYHWKLDAAGKPTDIPNDTEDDECDALRYFIMGFFAKSGRLRVGRETPTVGGVAAPAPAMTQEWLGQAIRDNLGEAGAAIGPATTKGRKGRFIWDM